MKYKKMTSKEFREIMKQFYFQDYECVLNIIALHLYKKYEDYVKENREELAKTYKEDWKRINDILNNRGYWDRYNN